MEFDHVGVVVRSIEKARGTFGKIFGIEDWTEEFRDPINGVVLQFGRDPAGICYELLEPIDEASPVYPALSSGKAILNHMAYRVSDLTGQSERLRRDGCAPTSEPKPAIAYKGKRIQFFVTPLRFVIELIEAPEHVHVFAPLVK